MLITNANLITWGEAPQILADQALRVEGDGSEKLDFTYIDDLVEGVCLAIQSPASRNEIFNLTYGAARSIQDIVTIIQKHFPGVEVEYVDRDKLMPFRGTLSVEKAAGLLDYSPKYPLEVGLGQYIEWYQKLKHNGSGR